MTSLSLLSSSPVTSCFLPFFFGFPLDLSCSSLLSVITSRFLPFGSSTVLSSSSLITSCFLPFFFWFFYCFILLIADYIILLAFLFWFSSWFLLLRTTVADYIMLLWLSCTTLYIMLLGFFFLRQLRKAGAIKENKFIIQCQYYVIKQLFMSSIIYHCRNKVLNFVQY